MKQIIKDVLEDMSNSQVNLASDAARDTISNLISAALKTKGTYTEYDDSEIEEQEARETWVCEICGENTFDVGVDYIGSGTNHLGCELEVESNNTDGINPNIAEDIDETDKDKKVNWFQGSEEVDGAYTPDEYEGWEESVKKESELKFDTITEELYTDEPYEGFSKGLKRAKELSQEALEEGIRREKNYSQKKHEDKVFGGDTVTDADFGHDMDGNYESTDTMTGHDHGKVWTGTDAIQKQIYNEMTSDGLPEGGDAQAVLESHKLADEIVDNQKGKWIYESPDGGKTVFRRPFSDYDPKNKEEIDWETKEPTGRKFTEYNNGNWRSKDEG